MHNGSPLVLKQPVFGDGRDIAASCHLPPQTAKDRVIDDRNLSVISNDPIRNRSIPLQDHEEASGMGV